MSEKAVSEEAASEEPTSDDDRAGSDPGDEHPALAETLTSLNPAEGPGLDAATVAAFAAGRSAPRVVPERETPEGEDPILGRVLGGLYQVEHRLGEGGMGTVYRANHVHLNRPFAVKVLSERVASSQQAVERLLQEAKTASSIEHDNIVDVVSFDVTDDGRVFLVMELLRGESLADALDHGPMPLERALPLAYQVADALQAAHDAGVIHRDLKPENVFLVRKGGIEFVKVLDFGISKVQSAEAEEVRMTRTGQLVGTPLYMSPEQSRGETDVDHRADVYALGIVLYEMLTGDPPFEGTNYFQLLWKHGNEPPQPLRKRARTVPKPVDQVVLRALAKRADERFASMSAFAAALLEAAPDVRPSLPTPTSLPPAPPELPVSRTPRGLLLALGAVALIAVGFGASRLFRDAPPAPVHVATPAPPVPDAAPAPEASPAALPEGEAPPARVRVELVSEPPATVHRGEEVLGETPLRLELAEGERFEARFVRRGYRELRREVVAAEGGRVEVALEARTTRSPSPRGGRSGSMAQDRDLPPLRTQF